MGIVVLLMLLTDMTRATGASITDDELNLAAEMYHVDNSTWTEICKQINTTPVTFRAARESDRWEEACKPYEIRKADLRRLAYHWLEALVREGGLPAVIQALDRTEGATEQTVNLKHSGGLNIKDESTRELLDEFEERLAERYTGDASTHVD